MSNPDNDEELEHIRTVILPMIRQIMPAQVARDLVKVQPMSTTPEKIPYEIGTSYASDNVNKEECYWISPSRDPQSVFTIFGEPATKRNAEILAWCANTYGPRGIWGIDMNNSDSRWFASDRKYYFRHESDRTLFILRWE